MAETIQRTTPPGPKAAYPGALLLELRRDLLSMMQRISRQYGDISYLKIAGREIFLLSSPEYIKDVLVTHQSHFHKGRGLERAKKMLGEGLLTSEDDFHKRQRRLSQPAFHRARINSYADVMTAYAERTGASWQDGATLDMHQEMQSLTLAIVGKTLFDADVEHEAGDIRVALNDALSMFKTLTLPFGETLEKLPLPSTRRFNKAKERLDSTIYRIIAERRANYQDKGDLLSMLLAAQDVEGDGGKMTDTQLRDEALTIFLAGHETTANALTWTWYLLSQNPAVEAKLQAELDEVLGGRTPTLADLAQLKYTEQVITESMRLYPPAYLVGRRVVKEHHIQDYVLPEGALVFMSIYSMHHDPRYYQRPDNFEPERWTAEFRASLPRFAYFPFGGGPRICIGEAFAWMETELILATLAQKWRMRLDPNQQIGLQPLVTLRPKYGMKMHFEKRGS